MIRPESLADIVQDPVHASIFTALTWIMREGATSSRTKMSWMGVAMFINACLRK